MEFSTLQQLQGHNAFSSPGPIHQQTLLQQQQQQQYHQQQQQNYQQQQQYQPQHPQNAGSPQSMYQSGMNQSSPIQNVVQPQAGNLANSAAFAVQPYASWGSGAILNMNTTRRPRPQAITGPPTGQQFNMHPAQVPTHSVQRPQSIESNRWIQKTPQSIEVSTYDSEMTDMPQRLSHVDSDSNIIDLRQLGGFEKDISQNGSQNPFQHEIESRRPSQVSDSTYATTRLTTPDMAYPSDSDWSSAERPNSINQSNFSPMESPSASSLRPGSRSRASPVPHNQMRASPYTLESNRRLRWSTGMNVPSQTPLRVPYQYNNRYSSQYGCSPLNPHNGLASVSNEQGVTTFAAPGQSLAYSQRMSAGAHFMFHGYPDVPRPLPSQSLFPLLPSDRLHAFGGHYADLSDPPDLFASLNETPSDPPEEDMNPSDPELIPHEQELRFAGDLYTPRWVRGHGNKREGWCGLCKPGRWLVLKNSAYWYDKSFTHGVCAQTGAAFAAPEATRRVEGNADAWEGLCGQCGEWLSLVSSKKKGPTTWFRHVSKCHVLHKPKDIPKRRRGTIKRPPLPIPGMEGANSQTDEVQASNPQEESNSAKYDHDHDHDHHHSHSHIEDHDHHMFNGNFGSPHPVESALSPAMVSPKTIDTKSTMSYSLENAISDTRETTVVPVEREVESFPDLKPAPLKFEKQIKTEDHLNLQQQENIKEEFVRSNMAMTDSDSVMVSCVDLVVSTLALEASKPEMHVQTQEFTSGQAPPSPDLTPISTPQLSETSLSTPQMETPSHPTMPLVGLGVQGLHIMTGIPEHSSHDLNFDDLSRLEELYGGASSSNDRISDNFSCDNTQSLSENMVQNSEISYSEPSDIPLPMSATENACMSSEFDMASTYPEHQSHELRSMTDFSDDVLGLHMDMRIALEHGNGHFSSMNGTNLLEPYGGMI